MKNNDRNRPKSFLSHIRQDITDAAPKNVNNNATRS